LSCKDLSSSSSSITLASSGERSAKPTTSPPVAWIRSATTFPCPPLPHTSQLSVMRSPERFHGGVPGLGDAAAAEDRTDGQQQDLQVQAERPVLHVPYIHLQPVFPGECVASIDLRPAGDPGPNLMPPCLAFGIERQVLG